MAANDLTYTNSASTAINLHGTTYKWRQLRGIYQPSFEPIFSEISAMTPAGVYETSKGVIRRIEVDVLIAGTSPSDLVTNVRTMMAALAVDMRDGALGTLAYTAPNSNARSIKVTPISKDADQWITAGTGHKAHALITLAFDAPDPTFYNPSVQTANGAFNGTNNVNVSCANAGDIDAYPEIVWAGIVTNGKVTDAYANYFQMTDTVGVGETLTMDFNPDPRELDFTHSVDGSWYDKQNSASKLVVVKRGTNNLVFLGGGAGDNGAITVNWYNRYSAHG